MLGASMDKDTRFLYLVIGFLLAVIVFLAGGKLRELSIFGAKVEFPTETAVITQTVFSIQPTLIQPQSTNLPISSQKAEECTHFQVASLTQTMVTVPAGMWIVVRNCSPAKSACFYKIEQSSGGQYLSYEHNGNADRYWVNAFCTEAEAKNFANLDAKAMLEWWPYTPQNPFP